jgi:hypothetical protein
LDISFLSELDFLRRGCTELDLNSSGKTPLAIKRKINDSSYGGKKSTSILFNSVVGIARIKITMSIR